MPAAALDRLLLTLTVEIAVIIAVSRLLGLLFRAVRQPQVIGEVVAGILLGPSLLGWAAPGLSAALFPPAALPFLKVLSEYGIVFFMFLIGLELDPALLRDRGRAAVLISGTSIVVPFALGAAVALALFGTLGGAGASRLGFAVFLGAAMSITAFPVLARILIERDLLRTRLGALTLTCAAVDDIAGWCLLSAVAALGASGGGVAGAVTVGWVLLYLAVMVGAVRPLLTRFDALYEQRGGLTQNLLATVFVLLLLSALATQWIGIHAIFGGFVFGAVMPKGGAFARELAEKVEDFATVFLLPLYFAYTGLRTQAGLLDSPADWLACALLIATAVAGKFGGSLAAARAVGLDWREASALGVLVNTRGLMELIILNLGLDLGLITPTVFAMMVLMAIATTMMASPALALLYPAGRLRAERVGAEPAAAGQRVLVSVALSTSGPRLLDVARALAGGDVPRIYALHVARPAERGALGALPPPPADHGAQALAPLLAHGRARGIDVHPLLVTSRTPADEICEVARIKGVELIVLGWHKPVFAQSVLGGTLDRVLRHGEADVAVLVDKGLPERLSSLLLPYAGTVHDRCAVRLAARLARHTGAALTLLHVVRPNRGAAPFEQAARAVLEDSGIDPATGGRVTVTVVESADPVDAVIAAAADQDLTVLGVGEEWQLERQLFGLRSERVAVEIRGSLLIVRAKAPA